MEWRNGGMAEWRNGNRMAEMVEWRNGGMAGMAVRRKEWQNSRMAEMATYVLFTVHTHTDDDDGGLNGFHICALVCSLSENKSFAFLT